MKSDWAVLLLLVLTTVIVYRQAFLNFFAQDDFILINQFSQNSLLIDVKNVFGYPPVTHWRPLHNLFFLVAGNIFGKNYLGYHVLTFLLQIAASFLVYKVIRNLTGNFQSAVGAGLLYGIHPAHFISMFWISGSATVIGFLLLISSINSVLLDKKLLSLILFVLALLASEAMIASLPLFYGVNLLKQRKSFVPSNFLALLTITALIFGSIRFLLLTSETTFDVYPLEVSRSSLGAIKYYLLRIAGFSETSGDLLLSMILVGWLIAVVVLLVKSATKKHNLSLLAFSLAAVVAGLFPFILIPSHLSPHYMNLSIFGFSILIALVLERLKTAVKLFFLLLFLGISIYNVNLIMDNNWVVKRSNLTKVYLEQIQRDNSPPGTKLIFDDNILSTSEEAYVVLGTGKAIDFWFKDKNYKYCFTRFEKCLPLP